jgi:hypothetical protein
MNTISPLFTFVTNNPIASYFSYTIPLIYYACNSDVGHLSYKSYHERLYMISMNTFLIILNPMTHVFILQDMYQKLYSVTYA